MNLRTRRNTIHGLLFVSPWLIGLLAFTIVPSVRAVYFSLCDYSVLKEPVFIGTANYYDLATDPVLWISLRNTAIYAVLALPLGLVLALGLALLLNGEFAGRSVFRTIFFLPSLVPLVALAILWQWILQGRAGVLNFFLQLIGVQGPEWLQDTAWTKPALVIVSLWGVGNTMIIFLAGLQDVPKTLYEAARLDGATRLQQLIHITLPMISHVIYFNLMMGCIGVLQVFAVPYVMTGGGPARSTLFTTMYLYDQAFVYLNMGYACAMAMLLFLLIAALTLLAHAVSRRMLHLA
jgi:multiple sugar transport system permease protein